MEEFTKERPVLNEKNDNQRPQGLALVGLTAAKKAIAREWDSLQSVIWCMICIESQL